MCGSAHSYTGGPCHYLQSQVRPCDWSPSRMPRPGLHWSFVICSLWRGRLTRKSTCAISLLSFWKSFSETLFERPVRNKVATSYGFLAKNGKTELDWWTQKTYKLWKTAVLWVLSSLFKFFFLLSLPNHWLLKHIVSWRGFGFLCSSRLWVSNLLWKDKSQPPAIKF